MPISTSRAIFPLIHSYIPIEKPEKQQCEKDTISLKIMRHPYFFLFFSVFILLYSLVNGYIFIHGWNMTEEFGIQRGIFTLFFLCFSCCYIVGEMIQQRRSSLLSDFLITFGSLWFVGVVHFFFVSIVYDIFLGVNHSFSWL